MKYTFQDILNEDLYKNAWVIFLLSKYNIYINIVADELKQRCLSNNTEDNIAISIADEFGLASDNEQGDSISTSVDFNTFIDVVGVPNINGKWFCKVDLASITKKQKDTLIKYIKTPSENGILVVTGTEWLQYKEFLKNKILLASPHSSLLQMNFPNYSTNKELIKQMFGDKGIVITSKALDYFIMRMNKSYDEYERVIGEIVDQHKEKGLLDEKQIKTYMKGIEYFDIDGFMEQIVKPLSSDKVNNKKIIRMMAILQDDMGAKQLVYKILKSVDEMIDYRLLINQGIIPIGINYFFKDVIKSLGGEEGPYGKVNEWVFRKKANLASQTSLQDWEYIKLILSKAIENKYVTEDEMDIKCQKALYEICTRSILTESRINNIIGVDNVLKSGLETINKTVYTE